MKTVVTERMSAALQSIPISILLLASGGISAQPSAGIYDSTFGNFLPGRSVVPQPRGVIQPSGFCILADGTIVSGGSERMSGAGFQMVVSKLRPDGEIDDSFGANGQLSFLPPDALRAGIQDITCDQGGNVFVAAMADYSGSNDFEFVVGKLDGHSGDVDLDYGINGWRRIDFNLGDQELNAIEVDADGNLALAGSVARQVGGVKTDVALVRIAPSGDLDPDFGTNGVVMVSRFSDLLQGANGLWVDGLAIQPDGAIVASSTILTHWNGVYGSHAGLVRVDASGGLDLSFGGGGVSFVPDSNGGGMELQTDGQIVMASRAGQHFAIRRFDENGQPDLAFGSHGVAAIMFFPNSGGIAGDIAIDREGRIVAVGRVEYDWSQYLAAARVDSSGSLDLSFGDFDNGGRFLSNFFETEATLGGLGGVSLFGERVVAGGIANPTGTIGNYSPVFIRLTEDLLYHSGFEE